MRSSVLSGALAASLASSLPLAACAEPSHPVDVRVAEPAPPRRWFAIEWNPLSAFLKRASFSVELVPASHHALTLNGYYFNTSTNPFQETLTGSSGHATTYSVPAQKFEGGGGELGYRYYAADEGPRGLFVGPSFLFAYVAGTAFDKSVTKYWDLGGAVDLGYQALLWDRIVLGVGAGIQYTHTTTPIPSQQLPAKVYTNNLPFPRALLSLGCAF